ncbi:MAG: gamma carbonic anhydrase family protein [Ottowia sp.]|nr:gamma carbonic anhydrase family protein [Ottowia sp.]
MTIYQLDDTVPCVDASAWIAQEATLIGKIELAADVSIWFGAVLRGDNELIVIEAGSNIQEGAVLHTDAGYPLRVGKNVSVGHQAVLHGCTIGDDSLIGMGAIILNGAVIGRHCLVGAGALVTENKIFPDNTLIVGMPARAIRLLSAEECATISRNAHHYVVRKNKFKTTLKKIML